MEPYIPLCLAFISGASLMAGLHDVRVRYSKNGSLRFLRIARLQMCWCVCRRSI